MKILRQLYGSDVDLYAYRTRNRSFLINSDLTINENKTPEEEFDITVWHDYEELLQQGMDAVFVTNPPDLHVFTAIQAANNGAHVFIEKPLSTTCDGLDDLSKALKDKGLVGMVGHQLRYSPLTQKLKECIDSEIVGKIISVDFTYAEYLPNMHKYEDYRTSHAATNERGGGSILSLNHDIDIVCHLLGVPNKVFAMGGQLSRLEMTAEDVAEILFQYSGAEGKVDKVARMHLDFVRRPIKREWSFIGDEGSISVDLSKNQICIEQYGKNDKLIRTEETYEDFVRDDMFREEVTDFMDAIKNKTESPLSIEEAAKIMEVATAALKSVETEKIIGIS